MLFNSYAFLFGFLPLALAGYFVANRFGGKRVAVVFLVLASLVYYGWWKPAYVGLVLASMVVNYLLGRWQSSIVASKGRGRKGLLAAGVAANLAVLGYYKYANFFADTVNSVFDTHWSFGEIVLPLAISFYTFTQIAYLVDAYEGKTHEYNFLDYCLFVLFFPHLLAGPIFHHYEILPQFRGRDLTLRRHDLAVGWTMFVLGLFKKVVLADTVSAHALKVFSSVHGGAAPDFVVAWVGIIAYTLQIYFDFSGYSDMAIGLGRMYGIKLPLNFDSPYKSRNIIDFWRRWHMTLSRFLRDYLYIPLGGNRRGRARRYLNLFLTMLLGGIWHGAGWTFVVWGALHGLYLFVNHAWVAATRNRPWARAAVLTPLAHALTLLAVMVGWVFFRAERFTDALAMLAGMAGLHGFRTSALTFEASTALLLGALSVVALTFPNSQEIMRRAEPALDFKARPADASVPLLQRWAIWTPDTRWAVTVAGLAAVAIAGISRASEFLYYRF